FHAVLYSADGGFSGADLFAISIKYGASKLEIRTEATPASISPTYGCQSLLFIQASSPPTIETAASATAPPLEKVRIKAHHQTTLTLHRIAGRNVEHQASGSDMAK